MLTSALRFGGPRSAVVAALASCFTFALAQVPGTAFALPAAPCDPLLGCGGPPGNITPINNCLDPAICGTGGQGPAGGAQPVAAPADIAAAAAAGLQLPVITANSAPGGTTYAKLLTYLYVLGWQAPPAVEATQTGETVRVTATPYYTMWDLVETQQRCDSAGSKTSPECTYTYNRASANGGKSPYSVTATVYFKVHWECTAGCAGAADLPDIPDPSGPYNLTVGEIQGVNSNQ